MVTDLSSVSADRDDTAGGSGRYRCGGADRDAVETWLQTDPQLANWNNGADLNIW